MTQEGSILGAESFFRGLAPDIIERLALISRHVSFPAGYRLFDEDMPARNFWIIDAGQAALDTLVPGVGRIVVEKLGRGDVVGLSWLQPPYQFRFGAITTQPMQAFEFDAAQVRHACREDPVLGRAVFERFLAVAAHRLQVTRARLLTALAAAA
jgi:CRP/FNR family transcriptional regulator, cyclic AMP receptor protein